MSETLSPFNPGTRLEKIVDVISEMGPVEFFEHSAADDINELSSNTEFDSIEVAPETVFEKQDGKFEASAVVYVTLHYGGKRDGVTMPDSYPAIVEGSVSKDGAVVVETIRVDTSRFYE